MDGKTFRISKSQQRYSLIILTACLLICRTSFSVYSLLMFLALMLLLRFIVFNKKTFEISYWGFSVCAIMLFLAVIGLLNGSNNYPYYIMVILILYCGVFFSSYWEKVIEFHSVFEMAVSISLGVIDGLSLISIFRNGLSRLLLDSVGSSINVIAAYNVIITPLIIKKIFDPNIRMGIKFYYFCLFLCGSFLVISSGSRSGIILLLINVIILVCINLTGKSRKYFLGFVGLCVVVFIAILNSKYGEYLSSGFERIAVFKNSSNLWTDNARRQLINQAKECFSSSNPLIGIGTNRIENGGLITQPHNFVWEILLHSGYLGLLFFGLYWLSLLRKGKRMFCGTKKDLLSVFLVIFDGVVFGLTHPLLTCSMLFSILLFNLFFYFLRSSEVSDYITE